MKKQSTSAPTTENGRGKARRRHRGLQTALIVLVMLVGAGLLLYPTVADYWNRLTQSRAITSYNAAISDMDPRLYQQMVADAKEYNRQLAKDGINWTLDPERTARYRSLLNYTGNGIMGYIQIDKLDLMLPIYHGTSASVLSSSIGHLEQTSLPVGAYSFDESLGTPVGRDGSHCALSGHRGLPSARLFSDLDKLTEGDTFTITVLNESYTYEIDQILTVLPQDISPLRIVPGKDYCTLITCTPYGVNTHRLLVRGVRVGTEVMSLYSYRVQSNAILIRPIEVAPFLAAPLLPLLFLAAMIRPGRKRKKTVFDTKENVL
jgi:sortase A